MIIILMKFLLNSCELLGQAEDILLVYSTSGNSRNVVSAVKTAHEKEMTVIALTGKDGGTLSSTLKESDIEIRVPSAVNGTNSRGALAYYSLSL